MPEEFFNPKRVFRLVVFLGSSPMSQRVEVDLKKSRVGEFSRYASTLNVEA